MKKAWDRLVRNIQANSRLWLVISALITVACIVLAPGVRFNPDPTESLQSDNPDAKFWLEMTKRFDGLNTLMIGLEEPGEPFTQAGLRNLDKITRHLSQFKNKGVLWVRSIANVESIAEGEDGMLHASMMISSLPETTGELGELKAKIAADTQVSGALISRDFYGYQILIRTDPSIDQRETARLVQKVVDEDKGMLRAYYFGSPFFSNMITNSLFSKLIYIVPAFVLLFLIPALFIIRSYRIILFLIFSAALPLLWWLGLMRLIGMELTLTSVNAALFLLVAGTAAFGRAAARRVYILGENPLPMSVPFSLLALALASLVLSFVSIPYLSRFFAVLSVGSVAFSLFSIITVTPALSFLKTSEQPAPFITTHIRPSVAAAIAVIMIAGGIYGVINLRFFVTPQNMFSSEDEAGKSLAFFDRRFGGSDFIQVNVKGDLRDPSNAARLMRFTDLVETNESFKDVRTITQILSFLNGGFGGTYRIPASRDALSNIWFFLEGSQDVRPMVNDSRNEAMAVLRIPLNTDRDIPELAKMVDDSIILSLDAGTKTAAERIKKLAAKNRIVLDDAKTALALSSAASGPTPLEKKSCLERTMVLIEGWFHSPDSPFVPDKDQMENIRNAVFAGGDIRQSLGKVLDDGAKKMNFDPSEAADTIASRVNETYTSERSKDIAGQLLSGRLVPEQLSARIKGIISDLISPPPGNGSGLAFKISGLPVVEKTISGNLKKGLLISIALLMILLFLFMIIIASAGVRSALSTLIESALATLGAFFLLVVFNIQTDSGSAILCLLAPITAFFSSRTLFPGAVQTEEMRFSRALIAGLSLSALSLTLSGIAPAIRLGNTMALTLISALFVTAASAKITRSGSNS